MKIKHLFVGGLLAVLAMGSNSWGADAPDSATYITDLNDASALPNSQRLVPGANVALDKSPGVIAIKAVPGGANGELQFNSSGVFGGTHGDTTSKITYDKGASGDQNSLVFTGGGGPRGNTSPGGSTSGGPLGVTGGSGGTFGNGGNLTISGGPGGNSNGSTASGGNLTLKPGTGPAGAGDIHIANADTIGTAAADFTGVVNCPSTTGTCHVVRYIRVVIDGALSGNYAWIPVLQ